MIRNSNNVLELMIEELDIPDSAYDKAVKRYEDIGVWFSREESSLVLNDPHVFSQGSFRLGTVIRPLNNEDDYDLDLACKLNNGITKSTHTQKELKEIIGNELENYRIARQIKEKLKPKHRCWRLEYQDSLNFHEDIVPCIPAIEKNKTYLFERMIKAGVLRNDAELISNTAVSITDDRSEFYNAVTPDWELSNPEGYAVWFDNRLKSFKTDVLMEKAKVDEIPLYKKKTPLQSVIQLLKRHRDVMFVNNQDSKPISIIITTLAARAYKGENDVKTALENIIKKMGSYVHSSIPRVPNPVNPEEDFADRWSMVKYQHLFLEKNFMVWLQQAQIDFENIVNSNDMNSLLFITENKFFLSLDSKKLIEKLTFCVNQSSKQFDDSQIIIPQETHSPWLCIK